MLKPMAHDTILRYSKFCSSKPIVVRRVIELPASRSFLVVFVADRLEKICHPCAEPGDRVGDRGSGPPEISRAIGFYRNKQ